MRSYALMLAAGACTFGLIAGAAQAFPLANSALGLKSISEEPILVEQAAHPACNRVCLKGPVEEWGGTVRWHRHVGQTCRPIKCKP